MKVFLVKKGNFKKLLGKQSVLLDHSIVNFHALQNSRRVF